MQKVRPVGLEGLKEHTEVPVELEESGRLGQFLIPEVLIYGAVIQ